MSRATLYCGDALAVLKTLPDESVQCVVTSPPYWGLRDYGIAAQLGREGTPEEYVANMVAVFCEVRRVLRDNGTLWLNIGDSYANGKHVSALHGNSGIGRGRRRTGLKPKDLIGIPWILAFALRADGWFLRQCNIWAKPNGMPESVRDRSTVSHEYVFHLSKCADYFYDAAAARTPMAPSSEMRLAQDVESQTGSARANGGGKTNGNMKAVRHNSIESRKARAKPGSKSYPADGRNGIRFSDKQRGHSRRHHGFNDRWDAMEKSEQMQDGANLRSVWWVAPAQYRGAHYAVMPETIARICILAGSRPGDTVLDPFGGTGTTAAVAVGHGRAAISIDLDPRNLALAQQRIGPLLCEVV